MNLIQIASDFRRAIEEARDAGEFDRDQRFIQFPKACCGITTDLLAKFLIDNEFEGSLKYVGATCRKKGLGLPNHAWLEIDDSVIIAPLLEFRGDTIFVPSDNTIVYVKLKITLSKHPQLQE